MLIVHIKTEDEWIFYEVSHINLYYSKIMPIV